MTHTGSEANIPVPQMLPENIGSVMFVYFCGKERYSTQKFRTIIVTFENYHESKNNFKLKERACFISKRIGGRYPKYKFLEIQGIEMQICGMPLMDAMKCESWCCRMSSFI